MHRKCIFIEMLKNPWFSTNSNAWLQHFAEIFWVCVLSCSLNCRIWDRTALNDALYSILVLRIYHQARASSCGFFCLFVCFLFSLVLKINYMRYIDIKVIEIEGKFIICRNKASTNWRTMQSWEFNGTFSSQRNFVTT